MSTHILCLTSAAGLPIFARKKGNVDNLPFSLIGSLNGVHIFTKSQQIQLLNTSTKDYCVVWKEFYDSIVLIAVASGCTVQVLEKLLESVFNAMILLIGIEELTLQKNVERLKRELRVTYQMVDRLVDSLDNGDPNNKHSSSIVAKVEAILCPENHLIQIVLDSYMECVDSVYSCILIHGKIAVATETWWELHADELKLLSILATTDSSTNSKEIPVFLPYKSPTIAYRFVVCTLIPNVHVCSLCGTTPTLQDIEHSALQCFKSTLEILERAVQCKSANIFQSFPTDSGIIGFLLINNKRGKYVICRNQQVSKRNSGSNYRLDILRTFYYQSVLKFLISNDQEEKDEETAQKFDKKDDRKVKKESIIGKETYWTCEYHKCHAYVQEDDVICVLYNSSIPMGAMRLLSAKILKHVINDKQYCW